MKLFLAGICLIIASLGYSSGKEYKLGSPDGRTAIKINAGPGLEWSAICAGKEIITSVKAGLILGNNRLPGENETDLSFLPAGRYRIEIFADGINAAVHAQDYSHQVNEVMAGDKIKINMTPGGGWLARKSPL